MGVAVVTGYRFSSVRAALARYFLLESAMESTKHMTMNHDERRSGTRLSGDSNEQIEWLDLGRCLSGLSRLEMEALRTEYTCAILPAAHPSAASKVDVVEVRCGERLTEAGYQMVVNQAQEFARDNLERAGWIPVQRPTSLFNRLWRAGNRSGGDAK